MDWASAILRFTAVSGHAAIWPAAYAAACAALLSRTLGTALPWTSLAPAFLAAWSVYLLDRVKIRDDWLDEADIAGQPTRHAWIRARLPALRGLAYASGTAAAALWLAHEPFAALLVLAGCLGGFLYAGRPSGRRMKDRAALKLSAIVLALVTLAAALNWRAFPLDPEVSRALTALACLVAGDAVLCDISDLDADAAHGTRTVAHALGATGAWTLACTLSASALALAAATPAWPPVALALLASLLLPLTPTRLWRDLVDVRLPLALLATVAA